MWKERLKTRKLVGGAAVIKFSVAVACIGMVAGRKDVRVPKEQWR